MLDRLREGNIVVARESDRLSRAVKDVLHIMERTGYAIAGFPALTENIGPTTPVGCMMIPMMASFAEFERAMIREPASAGLAALDRTGLG